MFRVDIPIDVGREEARRAAERELSRPDYSAGDPPLPVRALSWLLEQLGELLGRAAATMPGGCGGLIALAVLLVLAVVAIRLAVGRVGRVATSPGALFDGAPIMAADHRRAADAHAAAGEWAPALRERLRAVVRELEERGLLDNRAGRTADEVAVEAGRVIPSSADQLRAAARSFDDVWYGGRPATPEMDERLRAVDEAVQHARAAS
jgi:uncharacterized protein DUF4129